VLYPVELWAAARGILRSPTGRGVPARPLKFGRCPADKPEMLQVLKRWFPGSAAPAEGWDGLAPWAASRQYVFRGVREKDGFVVDGRAGAMAWRLEWGPSQRPYVPGNELRLRAELGLQHDLQALVLTRSLQEQMENAVFDQYVEGVQTRIDNQTPPEMRWLVMFPKLGGAEMGALRDRYAALASIKPWLTQWLDGPLRAALVSPRLPQNVPVVLMISRGRLTLRTAVPEPEPRDLEPWLHLFETAMREARRVASLHIDTSAPSTLPSLWSASALPPGMGRE
jgi:hypothetical protein